MAGETLYHIAQPIGLKRGAGVEGETIHPMGFNVLIGMAIAILSTTIQLTYEKKPFRGMSLDCSADKLCC